MVYSTRRPIVEGADIILLLFPLPMIYSFSRGIIDIPEKEERKFYSKDGKMNEGDDGSSVAYLARYLLWDPWYGITHPGRVLNRYLSSLKPILDPRIS